MADNDNIQEQKDEIEALAAIFEEDFSTVDSNDNIYEVRVRDETDSWFSATIQLLLPPDYPSKSPPVFEIHSEWMSEVEMNKVVTSINEVFKSHPGECVIFQITDVLRESVTEKSKRNINEQLPRCSPDESSTENSDVTDNNQDLENFHINYPPDPISFLPENSLSADNFQLPDILHGEPMEDRRSTFQAHAAQVVTHGQVKAVIEKLKENKKIACATHNVVAYRIFCEDKNSFLQDYDDDGETAAGNRLLHLFEILDVRNVVVMVSRWYGGIKLGPDRFKHINNCARELLKSGGFFEDSHENEKTSKSKNKIRHKKGK